MYSQNALKIVPETFFFFTFFFSTMQYLPQLTSSGIFPALDNKKYYSNLRKFNYHLPNIWARAQSNPPQHHRQAAFSETSGNEDDSGSTLVFNEDSTTFLKILFITWGVSGVSWYWCQSMHYSPTCLVYVCCLHFNWSNDSHSFKRFCCILYRRVKTRSNTLLCS